MSITLEQLVACILGVSGFLVAVDKIYDLAKKHNPNRHLEETDIKIVNEVHALEDTVYKHTEDINRIYGLLGNDNEHLKKHDIQIDDIIRKREEDKYYTIHSLKTILLSLRGVTSDEDLKKASDELDAYEKKAFLRGEE